MKTSFMAVRVELAQIMLQLFQVANALAENGDQVDDDTAKLLGVCMCHVVKHCRTVITIIDNPDVIAPPAGKRCIFY